MPTLQQFQQWLIDNNHPGAAAAYPGAINRISEHYSRHIEAINIYDIDDAGILEPVRLLYQTGRRFGDVGAAQGGLRRAAINKYRDFLQAIGENGEVVDPPPAAEPANEGFAFEQDLQRTLCRQIEELFPGYTMLGRECSVGNLFIDVLLEKPEDNSLLVIELKAGVADARVLTQIAKYMGLLRREHPGRTVNGMIIAADISEELRLAVDGMGATNISLQTYQMSLQLNADE